MMVWLVENGIQSITLITLAGGIWKVSGWKSTMENRMTNIEGWLKAHIERHPGES